MARAGAASESNHLSRPACQNTAAGQHPVLTAFICEARESPSAHRLLARLLAAPDGAGQVPRHPITHRLCLGSQAAWGKTPGKAWWVAALWEGLRDPENCVYLSLMKHVSSWQQSAVLRGLWLHLRRRKSCD